MADGGGEDGGAGNRERTEETAGERPQQQRGRRLLATAGRTSASRPERPQPPKPATSTEPPATEGEAAGLGPNARRL